MDPTLVAQGGFAVALAIALVAVAALWKQLLKVQAQRDAEREPVILALQSATDMVKTAGQEAASNRTRNEERDRELVELRAELAGYRRGGS